MDWTWLENLIYPQLNSCHLCDRLLHERETYICEDCFNDVYRHRIPRLERKQRLNDDLRVFSTCWYEAEAMQLIVNLKYHHDSRLSVIIGYLMAEAFVDAEIETKGWVAVPVPTHPKRLEERRYNQAELIAQMFCKTLEIPLITDAVRRIHFTGSQVRRNRRERLEAMQGVFEIAAPLEGMNILLIDDVLTTGATLCSCTDTLRKGGAASVMGVTFCRA